MSSETITRTTQRAASGSATTLGPSASITGEDWASSAVAAASPAANQAARAGVSRTRRSAERTAVTSRCSRVADPGRVGGHETADPPGLAMDVCHVQLVAVREVPVEGGAGAARGPGDIAHGDRADAVLGEQLARGVEDLLGGHPGAVLGRATSSTVTHARGTVSGRRT